MHAEADVPVHPEVGVDKRRLIPALVASFP